MSPNPAEKPSDTVVPSLPAFITRPVAWRRVRTPRKLAVSARRVVMGFLALALIFAFVPWQQNAPGAGRVIAFVPQDREQLVESPVKGRVATWFVREGDRVAKGDPLVELTDNDPDYMSRLGRQRELADVQLIAARAKVDASLAKIEAARGARIAAIAAADAKIEAATDKIEAARQELAAAEAESSTAIVQEVRAEALASEGLASTQSRENYSLKAQTAAAKMREAQAKIRIAEADLRNATSEREKAITEADGKIAAAESELQAANAESSAYEQKLVDLDVKVSRQSNQVVVAPADGFIAKIWGGQGGEQVKEADKLLQIVPDTDSRAVELWVDGNDAALLRPGQEVRLQFEGWPALQFAGWPSVAVGTFGGTISFIDAIDDGAGQFRIVILPMDGDHPWPEPRWLRQGLRAKGWVMLASVPLGYELWRQLNDFPPAVTPPGKDEGKAGGEDKGVGDPIEKSKAGKAWRPK